MSSEYLAASEEGAADNRNHGYKELSSDEPNAESNANPSRPTSSGGGGVGSGGAPQKHRSRVRFNSTSEANDLANQKSKFPLRDKAISLQPIPHSPTRQQNTEWSPPHSRNNSGTNLLRTTPEHEKENPFADPVDNLIFRPKASVLRHPSYNQGLEDEDDSNEKSFSALAAQERAQRLSNLVGSHSAPASRRNSLDEDDEDAFVAGLPSKPGRYPVRLDDIPLVDMNVRRTYDGAAIDSDEDDLKETSKRHSKASNTSEAHQLVRQHTRKIRSESLAIQPEQVGLRSGQVTPVEEQAYTEEYVPRPAHYRGGVLSSLLKLYNAPQGSVSRRGSFTSTNSPSRSGTVTNSGATTPRTKQAKWYNHKNSSQDTLAGLIEASAILGAPGGATTPQRGKLSRPGLGKRTHTGLIETAKTKISNKPRLEDEIRITVHIAETLSRQKYLFKLCKALMSYGAPTHRLEEYMKMSARVLEIDGQFLYFPGCMIISFDDAATHTTEVKLVKSVQGVNLGKLKDVWDIYKEVVHDVIGVEEATQRLIDIIEARPKHNPWLLVLVYGFASATVAPFAFEGRLIDLPIAFLLGCILGFLQLIVAPRSELYSNVFEISAAVLTSFLARAFGSIRGGSIFCFSGLAQSSIALILPGYMVLCGSLELQSRSMVAGSVRMVYAIIYSLFLGFGITIGTAFYGLMDPNASSATTCTNPIGQYYKWIFVPLFALSLCIINQAKWKQIPMMLIIAFIGYVVNFFSAKKFPSSAQISNTLGALAVGVVGNLYSRIRHGVAAAALLPAIFVQVPSGLAASGSLLAGINNADQITNTTTYTNGTARANGTSSVSTTAGVSDFSDVVFNVGYSMIQVAIGITVGLFLSALIVYPFGKKRSGLFSF
ncbi:Pheromone-regulated membrane protein [Lachnellula hyalina]|uniref:Pheromone-regulated membrane protein n=1 Tax=Lachnellula hyalina TaxID=1316788 RepID=A0A8H8QYH7_9HELO|nr:Pheromone-regulated membrane protein [Lachnellula hyalina]TVY25073.1 Pheromone-regulated membrane protein [Lachnellula hyalina]